MFSCLLQAGEHKFFHLIFTEPGKQTFAHPCMTLSPDMGGFPFAPVLSSGDIMHLIFFVEDISARGASCMGGNIFSLLQPDSFAI